MNNELHLQETITRLEAENRDLTRNINDAHKLLEEQGIPSEVIDSHVGTITLSLYGRIDLLTNKVILQMAQNGKELQSLRDANRKLVEALTAMLETPFQNIHQQTVTFKFAREALLSTSEAVEEEKEKDL